MIGLQWKTTSSHSLREFGWKSIMRYFITPAQKRHQDVGTKCWRLCGFDVANHFHLFWECPKIRLYWQDIHKCLETIFRIPISFDVKTLFLGTIEGFIQTTADKYLMRIFLIAGKKALTRKWLQPNAPSKDDWFEIIHEIYIMERLTFSIKMQSEKCKGFWSKWVKFIGSQRPDLI